MGRPHRVVLTGVANPTHLLYAASYLRRLLAHGDQVDVVSPPGGPIDPTAGGMRALLPEDPALRVRVAADWACPPGHRFTYVSVGAPGLKAYARLRRANPRRAVPVVVTDEGLGTYGTWRTRRAAWGREGVADPWRTIRALAVAGGARALTTQRWPLYTRDGSTWRVVEEAAQEFRRRVPARESGGSLSRRVVLLSQPWPELGVLPERSYLRHVERLADQVAVAGGELTVRAHPSEPRGRYGSFPVLATGVPVEIDPVVVDAGAVLGGPSTALLNLAAVHGVPAVRLGVPGRPDLDVDGAGPQAGLLAHFLGRVAAEEEIPGRLDLG